MKPVFSEKDGKVFVELKKNPLSQDIYSIKYDIVKDGKDRLVDLYGGGIKSGEGCMPVRTTVVDSADGIEVKGAEIELADDDGTVRTYYLDLVIGDYIDKYREK